MDSLNRTVIFRTNDKRRLLVCLWAIYICLELIFLPSCWTLREILDKGVLGIFTFLLSLDLLFWFIQPIFSMNIFIGRRKKVDPECRDQVLLGLSELQSSACFQLIQVVYQQFYLHLKMNMVSDSLQYR